MNTISINYSLVWRFKTHRHIQVSRCKKVFNTQRRKLLKQTINGGSIGYWIDSKTFIPISKINALVEKIPPRITPF